MQNLIKQFFLAILLLAQFLWANDDLAITVTNANLALVRETRNIELDKGTHPFHFMNIPSAIDPSSVHIESMDQSFTVLEQNYEYDLVNVSKVLKKALDQKVQLVHPELGEHRGKLLSVSEKYLMLLSEEGQMQIIPRSDKLKVLLDDYQKVDFRTKPTLVWQVDASKKGSRPARISYLSGGLDWHADYVGTLNGEESKLTLSSWVTVENKSGMTFKNTRLKLMAGDLNIVKKMRPNRQFAALDALAGAAEKQFSEKAFFEYHLYSLQRKTTLANNQVKQIQLFPETKAKIHKKYLVESSKADRVSVSVSMKNSEQNNLGMALPGGKIRLFKADGTDMEFIGEDMIKHTPEDEELKITIGQAFDIVSERVVLKTERPTKNKRRLFVEYKLRNHKEKDVIVQVLEQLNAYQQSKLNSSSVQPSEKRADRLVFDVSVPAKEEAILKIEFEQSW